MKFDNLNSFVSKCIEISEQGIDIYIVGAGDFGRKIAKLLNENNVVWKCFVDKIKAGTCEDKPVITYEECIGKKGFYIVSSIKYTEDMINNLKTVCKVWEEECVATFDDSVRAVWRKQVYAEETVSYVLKNFDFHTVLDVGSGGGIQSDIFLANGKSVTAIDYGQSYYFNNRRNDMGIKLIIADINSYESEDTYDLVWCSHVLEHQLNPHFFLVKLHSLVKENGILAVTVPPLSSQQFVQGGHVSVWNAGLLLYHLVLAGFDCRDAHIKKYEYNLSVVVEKRTINVLDKIHYDRGDIRIIKPYLPKGIDYIDTGDDDHFFGDIKCLNWSTDSL